MPKVHITIFGSSNRIFSKQNQKLYLDSLLHCWLIVNLIFLKLFSLSNQQTFSQLKSGFSIFRNLNLILFGKHPTDFKNF